VVTRRQLVAELGDAMQRYQRSVQAYDDAVGRALALGPADLRCLDWLVDGPKTAGALATATGLRPAATTALIDRLEAKGLVERVRSETDRRVVHLRLTASGRDAAAKVPHVLAAVNNDFLRGFSEAEWKQLRKLI